MKIQFLGAAKQVTGSCYYLEADGLKILIDCGLFQERDYQSRNWNPFPVPPGELDWILLTHVHLDHSGMIPKLIREGFAGKILTTEATREMFPIVIYDTARIMEEDAAHKLKRHKKERRTGPYPVIPLYKVEDVDRAIPFIKTIPYKTRTKLNDELSACFYDAGHILGSAMVEIVAKTNHGEKILVFSGDIGQWDKPLVRDPSLFDKADYVIMESTYGDREHDDPEHVEAKLCSIINETVEVGGNILIPTFAVERAQELLFHLSRLARERKIPYLMTFLDSPMAVEITKVFENCKRFFDEETLDLFAKRESPFDFPGLRLVRTAEESKLINHIKGSVIIMAGSGMLTGGRIKHHLVRNIVRPESTVIFVGYQARGTLGRHIIDGAPEVRIHGQHHKVKARIERIMGFSAHAGRSELLRWAGHFELSPSRFFVTHGEEDASNSLAEHLRSRKECKVAVPEYLEEFEL